MTLSVSDDSAARLDYYDLIIVGAGPAGSAAALAALGQNPHKKVLMLDKLPTGRDKVCGDGIGPDVPSILADLDAHHILRTTEAVSEFRVDDTTGSSLSTFSPNPGFVIPRTKFDERLLREALNKGAVFAHDALIDIKQDSSSVTVTTRSRKTFTAPYLVAADGANSVVRRKLGIVSNKNKHIAVAIRGYTRHKHTNELLIRWDSSNPYTKIGLGYAWRFPIEDGSYNIGYGMSLSQGAVSRSQLLDRLRALNVTDADLDTIEFKGHQLPLSTYRPRPVAGRVMLVGDAASLINPLSGEGIIYALVSGKLAGESTARKDGKVTTSYEENLKTRLGSHHRDVNFLSYLSRYPKLVSRTLSAAQADSQTLNTILSLALGEGNLTFKDYTRFPIAFWKAGRLQN